MEIDYKHALADADALARLKALGDYLAHKHGIQVTWENDQKAVFHGKYLVVRIDGELTLEPGAAHFHGKDPGFLWRKKASDYIRGKLEAYLDPATALDDLPRS